MKQKLLKPGLLRPLMLMLILLGIGGGKIWGAEAVYKTALFGSSYNSKSISDYTSTWTATNDGFTVSLTNFNNNNNGWGYVKCGRKNTASVATIITSSAIDQAITKVVLTIDALTTSNVNSIKLYTSSNGSTWNSVDQFGTSTGAKTVTLSSPVANLYYKIEFDCKSGSSNGLVQVSKIQFYYDNGGGTNPPTPTGPTVTLAPLTNITSVDLYYIDNDVIDINDGDEVTAGTEVFVLPHPAEGYVVSSVTVNDASNNPVSVTANSGNWSFTMPSSNVVITVTATVDVNAPGTQNNPYTVAQAITATPTSGNVYIRGTVTGFYNNGESILSDGNNYRYYISDAGSNNQLLVYKGKGLNQTTFSNASDLEIDDEVVIYGKLTTYNNAPQVGQNNYIVSRTQPVRPTHNVNFYVNGNLVSSAEVAERSAITFPVNPSAINGKVFMGWTLSALDGEQAAIPTMVSGATMGTDDVNYYAVFASQGNPVSTTSTLTGTEIQNNLTNVAMAYDDSEKSYNDTADDIIWTVKGYAPKEVPWIQLRKNNAVAYLKIEAPSAITNLKFTISNATNQTGTSTSELTNHGAFAGSIILLNQAEANATAGALGSTNSITDYEANITPSTSVNELYVQTTAAARIWDVEVTYTTTSYSGYCTTVPAPYTRTVSEGAWGTICLNRDAAIQGATLYEITDVVYGSDDKVESIGLDEVEVQEIVGGRPYIFKATSTQLVATYKTGVSIVEAGNANGLIGVYERTNVPFGCYVLQNGKFHKCVYKEGVTSGPTDVTVAANRAYIDVSQIGNSGHAKLYIPFYNTPTGVEKMEDGRLNIEKSEIFDLSGRRVNKATKGVYIVNGRKVAVK